jgi:uncharacterized protein (DUF2062 family)
MSLRNHFRRLLPEPGYFRSHERFRFLGAILEDPDIFHITRRSVAGGVATGLAVAWVPLPIQMLTAALIAIRLRVNLPLAVLLVNVTNPLTFAPVFYAAYRLGCRLMGDVPQRVPFEATLEWLGTTFLLVWKPLLLGCSVIGTLSAVAGYAAVQLAWRLTVVRKLRRRRERGNEASRPAAPARDRSDR